LLEVFSENKTASPFCRLAAEAMKGERVMLGFRRQFGRTKFRCHRRLQLGHHQKQKEVRATQLFRLADSGAQGLAAFFAHQANASSQ
jgi:hypothetical protein